MQPALWISKTGLDAQQADISTISNNLANASTVGFKKNRAVFEDLLYQTINQPGGKSSQDTELPAGLMMGTGVKVAASVKTHSQGNVLTTDNSLDWMIQGRGFFQIQQPDGTIAYTRNGQFLLNQDSQIVSSGSGFLLEPQIDVPEDAESITIGEDGEISVAIRGEGDIQVIGQLELADFVNPAGLQPMGQNMFQQTSASGEPQLGVPGLDGMGFARQGMLETSNVNVTEELINLIESQRVYEMNSKVISSVDSMMGYVNQQL